MPEKKKLYGDGIDNIAEQNSSVFCSNPNMHDGVLDCWLMQVVLYNVYKRVVVICNCSMTVP